MVENLVKLTRFSFHLTKIPIYFPLLLLLFPKHLQKLPFIHGGGNDPPGGGNDFVCNIYSPAELEINSIFFKRETRKQSIFL